MYMAGMCAIVRKTKTTESRRSLSRQVRRLTIIVHNGEYAMYLRDMIKMGYYKGGTFFEPFRGGCGLAECAAA